MQDIEKKEELSLEQYSTDITELAKNGLLDPVIGREKETTRVAQILSRRTKNNPVLIGEPGVGKTAIVENLAQMIADNECPPNLMDKKILSLDLASLVAGTKYRGQFEERIKMIIDELKKNKDIILFIDEMHTIIGAGSTQGSLDAANILKPALSRGEIQCIGATTFDEYRKSIEKDGALERRFQKVVISEPTMEETKEILFTLKDKYESFHNVEYSNRAIELCAELSNRFITERSFPDKAIDIMDEAGSSVATYGNTPIEIRELNKKLKVAQQLKLAYVKKQEFEISITYRYEEKKIQTRLDDLKLEFKLKERPKLIITEDDIRKVVSNITNIPVEKVTTEESKKYLELENILQKRVVGQSQAITAISKVLKRNKTAISNPNKPIGTFMFLGNSGVGKCVTKDTWVVVRNKETSLVEHINIEDFICKISND
jgi:ATP-dependent Clp protease ATP-binding subunit ClpC